MRRRPSPATVISLVALAVALGGTGYAAVTLPRNSVGTPQLKKGAVTAPKIGKNAVTAPAIKKGAVTSAKIARNAIDSARIRNGSITLADLAAGVLPTKVASAGTADTATSAQTAQSTAGITIIPLTRLSPTQGVTLNAGRSAAPEVTLLTRGAVSITAKCFRDPNGLMGAEVYAFSSASGAIMASSVDSLAGDANGAAFLNPSTPDVARQIETESTNQPNTASFNAEGRDFAIVGPDGTELRGAAMAAVKGGTLAIQQGVYGAGDTCLFGGYALG